MGMNSPMIELVLPAVNRPSILDQRMSLPFFKLYKLTISIIYVKVLFLAASTGEMFFDP
jgi:hypothetical protein